MSLLRTAACVALIAAQAAPVFACLMVGDWDEPKTPVLKEDVLIVWDPASGLEHFVRRIDFDESAKGFGFIVPVPSVPDIAEADERVFDRLAERLKPVKIYLPGVGSLLWFFFGDALSGMITGAASSMGSIDERSAPGVRVLKTAEVAGQTASVLEADDAAALEAWLKTGGYRLRGGLAPWLKTYIDAKWKFVAFQYNPAAAGAPVSTRAVRLSFKTREPFFPYREPEDQQRAAAGVSRVLRVFFVGPRRVKGRVGGRAWAGETAYAMPTFDAAGLLGAAAPAPKGLTWLTIAEDHSSPRPASDELYFSGAAPVPEIPYEVVWYPAIPYEMLLLILLLGPPYLLFKRFFRRSVPKPAP